MCQEKLGLTPGPALIHNYMKQMPISPAIKSALPAKVRISTRLSFGSANKREPIPQTNSKQPVRHGKTILPAP
jgi:hypothetical protein